MKDMGSGSERSLDKSVIIGVSLAANVYVLGPVGGAPPRAKALSCDSTIQDFVSASHV